MGCLICKKDFYVKPNRLARGWGKYCSKTCNYAAQKTGETYSCTTCGKKTYKSNKDVLRSKSGLFFCCKSCQATWRNTFFSGYKHSNWKGGQATYRNILRKSKLKQVCAKCQNSDARVLAVHHKDKNRNNNSVSNLIWLCHNCHYLVHHYKEESKQFVVPVA